MTITIDSLCHNFDKVEVLQVKAQGFTQLWQPEKALEIFAVTDMMRSLRPARDQCSYDIIKAQAHCYVGDTQTGIDLANKGINLAKSLQSSRYMTRLRQMSDRLSVTPLGQERPMKELRGEILATLQNMKR